MGELRHNEGFAWPAAGPDGARVPAGHNRDWVIPALIFVSVQYVFALLLSNALDFVAPSPAFRYVAVGFAVSVVIAIGWILVTTARLAFAGAEHPLAELAAIVRRNASNIIYGQIGIQIVGLQLGALTWLKAMLPHAVPFWADPLLADLDAMLFGGDPRLLIYDLLEPFTAAISYGYALWFLVQSGLLLAVLFSPAGRKKSQIMLAYFVTLGVFGVVGQYALSSAGPIFYERIGLGDRFESLAFDPLVQRTSDYLWMNYVEAGTGIGGGISAMPSVHVALAGWIALATTHLFRPFAIVGWSFFTFVFVASVFLGWHYALDSVAGALAAVAGWRIAAAILPRMESMRAAIPAWRALQPQKIGARR